MHTRVVIAVSVVLGLSFISIMVVVARFLWEHQRPGKSQKDEPSQYPVAPVKRRASLLLTGGVFKKLFSPVRTKPYFLIIFQFHNSDS
jgi:hypothetical protein